jgi:hypothetical protein
VDSETTTALVAALLGVVVGASLKAAFDWLLEGRRFRRDDRLRFLTDRRRAYADVLTISDQFGVLLPMTPDFFSAQVAELSRATSEAVLLAESEDVVQLLRDLTEAVIAALHAKMSGAEPTTPDKHAIRDALLKAMRQELGIKTIAGIVG